MNEPELIIADELTSDLDNATTKDIMKILYDIHKSGTALLMVTHEDDIIRDGDRVIHMEAGRLLGE